MELANIDVNPSTAQLAAYMAEILIDRKAKGQFFAYSQLFRFLTIDEIQELLDGKYFNIVAGEVVFPYKQQRISGL